MSGQKSSRYCPITGPLPSHYHFWLALPIAHHRYISVTLPFPLSLIVLYRSLRPLTSLNVLQCSQPIPTVSHRLLPYRLAVFNAIFQIF